jgi:hypothetical protein
MSVERGRVLLPHEITTVDGKVVFLGGPIQGAPDWQSDAIRMLHQQERGLIIASPRKDYTPGEFDYNSQVDWETHYLRRAAKFGAIMFWLARQVEELKEPGEQFPRAYAQTTRHELGEWRNEKMHRPNMNLVVGIEKGFGNARYIRRRLAQDCPDVPILSSLEDTCTTTIEAIEVER